MIFDHSIEAEQAVLGALLIDERAIDALDHFEPSWCYLHAHQEVGRAIFRLYREKKGVDPVTVQAALASKIPEPVPPDLVFSLAKGLGTASGIAHYAAIVRGCWAMRQARLYCASFVEDVATSDPAVAIAALMRDLGRLELGRGTSIVTFGEVLGRLVDALEAEYQKKPGTELVSSGFSQLDEFVGGFEAGVLQLYAARPHSGKSALAVAFALALGAAGIPTAIFWWEDAERKLGIRGASSLGDIPALMLRHGSRMHAPWWDRLLATAERVQDWPLYPESTKGLTPREAVQRMRYLKREKGVRVILADHMGELRLESDRGERHDLALGNAAKLIRDECDHLGICPVLFHQLGRLAETEPKARPRLGWLANSDVLGQAARTVGFLAIDGPAFRIHLVKGPPDKTVELGWDEAHMRVFQPTTEPAQGALL